MEELTAKIDRYLSGLMSEKEKQAFELDLSKDEALQTEVALQKKTMALLERGAYLDLKEKVATINKSSSSSNTLKPLLRIAAIIVVLLIPAYFYLNSTYSDESLYAAYSEPYPDRITHMGENGDEMLMTAMEHYNKEEYQEAAPLFKTIRAGGNTVEELTIYEAISLMNTDHASEAIELLENALQNKPDNQAIFEWQLVLAYLANDEGEKAIPLLETFLTHNNGYQQEKAESLLDDLSSFWR